MFSLFVPKIPNAIKKKTPLNKCLKQASLILQIGSLKMLKVFKLSYSPTPFLII